MSIRSATTRVRTETAPGLVYIRAGRKSALTRRVLSVGRHEFASGLIQASLAALPFFHRALPLAAVKFADGRVFGDLLDYLIPEPPPDAMQRLVASQFLFRHTFGPITSNQRASKDRRNECIQGLSKTDEIIY